MRPIFHYRERRVRAHLLLCMLAYSVQREMQQAQAPLLFVDEAPSARPDPVAPAPRSERALRKDRTQRTTEIQQEYPIPATELTRVERAHPRERLVYHH